MASMRLHRRLDLDGPGGRVRDQAGAFAGYQVDSALLATAGAQARVLHCLPAHRGEEITAEVLDGPQSVVWQQAANRMHATRALIAMLLEEA